MKISVNNLLGIKKIVEVSPDSTIEEVKRQIEKIEGTHFPHQKLTFNSVELENEKTISSYGINEGDVIDLSLKISAVSFGQSMDEDDFDNQESVEVGDSFDELYSIEKDDENHEFRIGTGRRIPMKLIEEEGNYLSDSNEEDENDTKKEEEEGEEEPLNVMNFKEEKDEDEENKLELEKEDEDESEEEEDYDDDEFEIPKEMKFNFENIEKKEQELLQRNEEINKQMESATNQAQEMMLRRSQELNKAIKKGKKGKIGSKIKKQGSGRKIEIKKEIKKKNKYKNKVSSRNKKGLPAYEQVEFEDDELDRAANEMDIEERVNYYKTRVKVLEKEVKDFKNKMEDLQKQLSSQKLEMKNTRSIKFKYKKKIDQMQKTIAKQKKDLKVQSTKEKSMEEKYRNLKKECEKYKKEIKDSESSNNQKPKKSNFEVKYYRLIDEFQKIKNELSVVKKNSTEKEKKNRSELEHYKSNLKKVEKQKLDLLQAFKKQLKLIDILKRQKIHIQNAKLLSFTEDEFKKVIQFNK